MSPNEPLHIVKKVVEVLDKLDIPYLLGGSMASSVHGYPRTTHDADIVVDMGLKHVELLVSALSNTFYMDKEIIRDAVQNRASFNIMHLKTMLKVDVFILKTDDFSREEMARREKVTIDDESGLEMFVASAEDTILQKLLWFQAGGGVSDRQWSDVIGILRVQGGKLDKEYLERISRSVGVKDLLEKACRESK
jgi:hypothetical protein